MRGAEVVVAYLTADSDPRRSTLRARESTAALAHFATVRSVWPGRALPVADGCAMSMLEPLFEWFNREPGTAVTARVYAFTWEGGHTDHDASHLLGVALMQAWRCELLEVSGYNSYRLRPPALRIMTLIPNIHIEPQVHRFGRLEGARYLARIRHYPSQWRTFLVLGPLASRRFLFTRALPYQPWYPRDYQRPPHPGRLFYQWLSGIEFDEFANATAAFLDARLDHE